MYSTTQNQLTLDSCFNTIEISGNLNVSSINSLRDGSVVKFDYFKSPYNLSDGFINTKATSTLAYEFTFTPKQINQTTYFVGIVYFNYSGIYYDSINGIYVGSGQDYMKYSLVVDNTTTTDNCFYYSINAFDGGGRHIPRPLIAEKIISANSNTPISIKLNYGLISGYSTNLLEKSSFRMLAYQYIYNSYKIYDVSGSYSGTIPYWCSKIGILLIGGGGCGGTGCDSSANTYSGGGGGGGGSGYTNISYNVTVTPNTAYSVYVGKEGTPYVANNTGINGKGETTNLIIGQNTYSAAGGTGGLQFGVLVQKTGTAGAVGLYSGSNGSNGGDKTIPATLVAGGAGGAGGIVSTQITHTFDTNIIKLTNYGNGGNGGKGGDLQSNGTAGGGTSGNSGSPGYAAIFFYEK